MVKLIIEFILFGCLAVFFCFVSWVEMPNAKDKKLDENVLYINVYVQLIGNYACSFSWELQRQQLRYQLHFSYQVLYPTSTLFRSRILAKDNKFVVGLTDSFFCMLGRQYYCWCEYVEYGTMKRETVMLYVSDSRAKAPLTFELIPLKIQSLMELSPI